MLTYVINTSENKTFDSDMLFDLAGYNKIKWMNKTLDKVKECAEEIYEKQNVLGADDFRIAVIVDFFTFDKIRVSFGRGGYDNDTGVDIGLYMPYIEAYLDDNLRNYLFKRDLCAADFEVYYVQNEKHEPYEFLDNEKEQVASVVAGSTNGETKEVPVLEGPENADFVIAERMKYMSAEEKAEIEAEKLKRLKNDDIAFSAFTVYCSKTLSLDLWLKDYNYGKEMMTFYEFYDAFKRRSSLRTGIRRHYYISNYGGGAARAAFDTLSLSLYLIRMYEREEQIIDDSVFEVIHLDADVLKDVLVTAWSKINMARNVAKNNTAKYYSLVQNKKVLMDNDKALIEKSEEDAIFEAKVHLPKSLYEKMNTGEQFYNGVKKFSECSSEEADAKKCTEFDQIMSEYLSKRDATRENNVEAEFEDLKKQGVLSMTDQCPSRDEYQRLKREKQQQISNIFEKVLKADKIEVDYKSERARADKAYEKYCQASACLKRSTAVDIAFIVLTVLSVLIPYVLFQLVDANFFGAMFFFIEMAGISFGFIALALIIQAAKYKILKQRAKDELKQCYLDCLAKERYSMSKIRKRYEEDLIKIEEARYEIRQFKHLFEVNTIKNRNVTKHRDMLAEVEDRLSSMLNNLDVEPVLNADETVEGEFDLSKSIRSRENKVYQIFSIETIERMFPRKGSGRQ